MEGGGRREEGGMHGGKDPWENSLRKLGSYEDLIHCILLHWVYDSSCQCDS